ncbi:MAG: LytTR family DNA-binding domain-containing protein [Clostridiales bacterium]|nr:LytTR family DNA-binding domain-containing protein [Clostridiales bacterium]
MIRIAVVDNAEMAAQQIAGFLNRYQEEHGLLFQVSLFRDGAELLDGFQPTYDLIFLDVEMPNKDGMTTAREIRKVDTDVTLVFVTRMAQYAVSGYEVQAMDFLVKPVSYAVFELRMDQLIPRLRQKEERYILISGRDGMRKLPVSRLVYVEVIKHRLLYHTEDGIYETSDTMKRAEELLAGCPFARCDNCYLVNLRYVTWVEQKELLAGNDMLKISRPRRKAFLQALTDYIGGVEPEGEEA